MNKLHNQITVDISKIRLFSDTYLLVLLDLALMNDPLERITRVLTTVSIDFPQHLLEIFVRKSITRAKDSGIEFEELADCLIKGLGDRLKDVNLVEDITKVYGFRAGERWQKIMKGSNNPNNSDDCEISMKKDVKIGL